MRTNEPVREARLRRMATRQGLTLKKSRTRDPLAKDYGTYDLELADGMTVIHGADLAGVERELAKGTSRRTARRRP